MKSILAAAALGVVAEALPFMRLFGIKMFQCKNNPGTHDGFNVEALEGKWHQVAANFFSQLGRQNVRLFDIQDHSRRQKG